MESNFNKDFEQYVKQNADQYRMFPSDKVWKGVNSALHSRRKWYGFWLGFILLMTGGAVTWVMTTQPFSTKENNIDLLNNGPVSLTSDKSASIEKNYEGIKKLLPFAEIAATSKNSSANGSGRSNITSSFIESTSERTTDILLPVAQQYTDVMVEAIQPSAVASINNKAITDAVTEPIIVDIEKISDNNQPGIIAADKSNHFRNAVYFPLTIESVTNAYQFKKPSKKVSWQLFITPTVSYRKLSLNKSLDNPSAFNYPFASLRDVNSAVTHKPDIGLQIGISGRYPITRSLKLRGGVQFNINRYDIKAYAFNGEVATIDLNGGNGNSSISTWTYYRNYAGYKSDWLKNYYFSISAPIGAEIKLFGNNKTNFGIAGTLQPTYILQDRAYLISTDYKNYAEVPRLIRHVNLNTGFETFVNYTNGKTKWQVGPQVRYQLLSSFHNTYPVKENLFDFGVKVGVTLNE